MRWLALLAICFTWNTYAGEAVLSWTPPLEQIKNCESEPLTGLLGYRIYMLVAEVEDPEIDTYTITGLEPGEYTFTSTAYKDGAESLMSNSATKTIGPLEVIDDRAYVLAKIDDGFLTVVAGTVPLGTACSSDHEVNGLRVVPADAVTWSGTVRDVLVLAECG